MADKPASGEIDEREEQGLLPPGALLSSSSDPQPPRQLSAAPILHGQIAQLDIRSDQSLTHLTRPYSEVEQSPRSPGQHADRASAAAASGTPAQRVEGFTGVEVPDAQQKPAPLYHPSGGIPSDSWPDKSRKMSELGNPARLEYEDRWQDTWASIVFCVHLIAMEIVAAFLGIKGLELSHLADFRLSDLPSFADLAANGLSPAPAPPGVGGAAGPGAAPLQAAEALDTPFGISYRIRHWAPQLAAAALVGAFFSWLWLQLIKLAPRSMVRVSLWWGCLASLALGVVLLATDRESGLVGLVFVAAALLQALYACLVRKRIPFAAAMLAQVVGVVKLFPATVWVSYGAVLFSMSWLSVWVLGAAGAMGQANSAAIVFGLLVSLFWTMQVIKNVVHVTVSGTVATYYYQRLSMPPKPTTRCLWRALTKSFGSICLGSFAVALLSAARSLVAVFRHSSNEPGNEIFMSCVECVLACIDSAVRYFNKWAYVQVAVYGKSFVRAARDTWDLFEDQGLKMLINDDLTGGVIFMGCFLGGVVCALAGGGWTFAINRDLTVGVSVVSFFIGYFVTHLTMAVIDSGVTAYYVCYAEDPFALQRNDPVFYEKLRDRLSELIK